MTKAQLLKLNTFALICKAEGKNESDYDVEKGKTAAEKEAICLSRIRLIYKPFNGKKKADIANTDQDKYYPLVWVEPDVSSPFGFRLSSSVCDCDRGYSVLGARPYLLDSDYVKPVFKMHKFEFEQLMHWSNMANQE